MRHRLTVRVLSCAAACILTAACGTLLSVDPVEGVPPDGGDSSAGDAAAVDGAAADGAQQLGNLVLDLAPRELVLYAGQAAKFEVRITRPPGDMTTLDLSPVLLPAGLTASPPLLRLSQGETVATFSLAAAADATPHRLSFDMRAAAHSAAAPIALPLTVLLSRAYRTATTATGIVVAPATDQTYKVLAWGAGGGAGGGGAGAFVTGTITVAAGNTILVAVGQGGSLASSPGTPGGGAGGLGDNIQVSGGGGGGYSGVFAGTNISFARAQLVAGAGGGGSSSGTAVLGGSGGAPGESGRGVGAGGAATPTSGGLGGGTGEAGVALTGGIGQPGDGSLKHAGGGGGGGYYGGGGGALQSGGGGGSCLVPANGTAASGSGQQPGNSTAPERNGAGAPGQAGAVILIPQ